MSICRSGWVWMEGDPDGDPNSFSHLSPLVPSGPRESRVLIVRARLSSCDQHYCLVNPIGCSTPTFSSDSLLPFPPQLKSHAPTFLCSQVSICHSSRQVHEGRNVQGDWITVKPLVISGRCCCKVNRCVWRCFFLHVLLPSRQRVPGAVARREQTEIQTDTSPSTSKPVNNATSILPLSLLISEKNKHYLLKRLLLRHVVICN